MGAFADGSVLGLPRRAVLLAGTGLASLFAAGLTVAPRPAAAQLPAGGQVSAGSATISQTSASRLDITQSTPRAVIDWRSFSIGAGNVVHFQQPTSSSLALNRVNGPDPSVIAGQLSANGRLVLVNPNGLLFSQGASVDTAGLVATTLGISNGDFMAGRMTFNLPGRDGAGVVNEGEITVREGGLAALVAPEVRNSGTIRARMGRVVLAGAESVTLDPRGDGLISFEVAREGPARTTRATNSGRIEADGGSVTISAASARGIVAGVVNVEGQVVATSVGTQNGVVSFGSGENGTTTVAGSVDVRGNGAGETGGQVSVSGERVRLAGTARIDASGQAGGGRVQVGGGRQGQGSVQRARRTVVEPGAVVRADATGRGDGGSVIVWSDEYTRFMGAISATGGALGGDGGFAEVSGRLRLDFAGTVDLRAPMGSRGTLLLDPTDITISAAADRDISATSPFQFVDDPPPGGTNGTSNLSVATLQAALAGGNVEVSTAAGSGAPAGGTITLADALSWSSGSTLTLSASTGIALNAPLTATAGGVLAMSVSGSGDITQAAGGILSVGTLSASALGGSVRLGNTANAIGAVGGQALGPAGSFTVVTTTNLASGPIAAAAGGRVELVVGSGRTLTIDGGISVAGGTLALAADTLAIGAAAPAGNVLLGGQPIQVEFRTATAGRSIVAGTDASADPGAATSLVVERNAGGTGQIDGLAPATGGRLRVGAALASGLEAPSGVVTITGLDVGTGDTGGGLIVESGAGGTAIRQTAAIDAVRLRALAPNGTVLLDDAANTILAGDGAGGFDPLGGFVTGGSGAGFTFRSANSFRIGDPLFTGGIAAPGQAVNLTSTGAGVYQRATEGGIQAATLSVSATDATYGQVILNGAGNAVGTVGGAIGAAPGAVFRFDASGDVTATNITATGRTIDIRSTGGAVTAGSALAGALLHMEGQTGVGQSAAIGVAAVTALSAGGSVDLTNTANSFTAIEGGTGSGSFSAASTAMLSIGNAEASVSGIRSGGDLTVRAGAITVAEAARAGSGAALHLETAGGGTLTLNAALAAPGGSAVLVADSIAGAGAFADLDRPAGSVIRPATANRSIGVAGGAGLLALSAGQVANLAPTAGGNLRIGSVNRTGAGEDTAGAITVGAIDTGATTLVLESGAAGTAISQTGAITAAGLSAIAPNGSLALGAITNSVGTLHAETNSSLVFQNAGALQVLGIDATSVALTALAGDITQATGAANAISTGNLSANAVAGGVALDNPANAAAMLQVGNAGGGAFAFTNGAALTVNDVTATAGVAIAAAGDLTLGNFAQISAGNGQRLALQAGGASAQLNVGIFSQLTVDAGTAAFVADRISAIGFGPLFTGPIIASEIRTATTGRGIGLGSGNAATELVLDAAALARLAPVSGGGRLRIGATGQVAGETATGAIQVNSPVNLAGGTVQLESGAAGAAISQTATIAAGELLLLAPNGGIDLGTQANQVGVLAGRAGGGGLALRDAGGGLVVGTVGGTSGVATTSDGPITLRAQAGDLSLTQAVNAGGGTVQLAADAGGITQAGAGVLTAGNLLAEASGAVGLAALSNAVGTVAGGAGAGGFALSNGGALAVGSVGGVNGVATAGNGTIALHATTGGLSLAQAVNAGAGTVQLAADAGAIAQSGGGGVTAGNLLAQASGAVGLAGAANAVGTVAGSAGTGGFLLLDGAGGLAVGTVAGVAGVATTAGGPIALRVQAGDLSLTQAVNAGAGTVHLAADAGSITQGGAGVVTADGLLAEASGAVALGGLVNALGTVAGSAGAGGFALGNGGALAVGTVDGIAGVATAAAGEIALHANSGDLSLTQQVNAGAGGIVRLAAGAGSITQSGAGVVSAGNLLAQASGAVALDSLSNALGMVAGSAGAGGFALLDGAGGLAVGTVAGVAGVATTAGGTIALRASAGDLSLTQAVNAGVGTVRLAADAGSVTQSGAGVITADALLAEASGAVALGGLVNAVGTVAGSAGAGGFALLDGAVGLAVGTVGGVAGVTTSGGPVVLHAQAGDLSLAQAVNGGAGMVQLAADAGSITEAGSGAVVAGSLLAEAAGDVLLAGANQIPTFAARAGDGRAVRLRDQGNLAVGTVAGVAGIGAVGPGRLDAISLATTGTASADALSIASGLSAATVRLQAGLSADGTAVATPGAGIRQNGGAIAADSVLARATGAVDLQDAANAVATFALATERPALATDPAASIQVRNGTEFALGAVAGDPALGIADLAGIVAAGTGSGVLDVSLHSGAGIAVTQPLGTAGAPLGTLQLIADGGDITGAAAGAVSAAGLVVVASGAVDLSAAPNAAGTVAGTAGTGGFALRNGGGGLVVGTVGGVAGIATAGGPIDLHAGAGDLSLAQAVNAGAGGTVRLAADAGGITQSGAGVVSAGGLLAQASGAVGLDGLANALGTVAGSAGAGGFALLNATGLAVGTVGGTSGVTTTAGGPVTLHAAAGDLSLVQGVNAGAGGTVQLAADAGGIIQGAGGAVTAGDLLARASGAVQLASAANAIGTVAGRAGTGGFALLDGAGGLSIGTVGGVAGMATTGNGPISLRADGGDLAVGQRLDAGTGGTVRLEAGGDLTQTADIRASALLAIAGGRVNLDATGTTNTVATFAARGAEVNFRNEGTLAIGSVTGDALVNGGLTQSGIAADPGPVRIVVAQGSGGGDLGVDQPVQSERMMLAVGAGGRLHLASNTLQGVGGGSPTLVVLDATEGTVPANLGAIPTFAGFSGGAPNTNSVLGGLVVGSAVGAVIELGQQTIPSASMVVLINGTTVTSTGSGVTLRGLAFLTRVGATNNRVNINGMINGHAGATAATVTGLSINPTDTIKLNNCPVATISCVVLPTTLPGIPPLGDNLQVGLLPPAIDPSTLTFINVGAEDTEGDQDDERRRVPVGRPAPAPQGQQGQQGQRR